MNRGPGPRPPEVLGDGHAPAVSHDRDEVDLAAVIDAGTAQSLKVVPGVDGGRDRPTPVAAFGFSAQ